MRADHYTIRLFVSVFYAEAKVDADKLFLFQVEPTPDEGLEPSTTSLKG